jgi:hypothetical protein
MRQSRAERATMILAYRLVRLIETHSEQLATGVLNKLKASEKCPDFTNVPPEDFMGKVGEIYHHLGEWLLGRTENDIQHRYLQIGQNRAQQGVPLSQLIWAIALTKDNLLEFLHREAKHDNAAEVFGRLEMLQLLEQFFDQASYYAACGHEGYQNAPAGN